MIGKLLLVKDKKEVKMNKKKKGLSVKQLHLLLKVRADSSLVGEDSPICIEEFKKKQLLVNLICDHVFRYRCCRKWLESATTCPICRRDQLKLQWFYKNESSSIIWSLCDIDLENRFLVVYILLPLLAFFTQYQIKKKSFQNCWIFKRLDLKVHLR